MDMTITNQLKHLAERYNLHTVYAFGSRASEMHEALLADGRENQSLLLSGSDIDIGVRFRSGATPAIRQKVELAAAFEDIIGGAPVDLVVVEEADPFLAAEIIGGERLFTLDEYSADEYDLYILRRAGDCQFLEDRRQALVLGKET